MERHDVTNARFMEFVEAGGYEQDQWWRPEDWAWVRQERVTHPLFWERHGDRWHWRGMFDVIPLPPSWPVYVSYAEATAYSRWRGFRLPTEAEFQRAAYGTTRGAERRYPWGDADPTAERGVFDFTSWDPEPAGSHPAGASAWGVEDLVGNGWEWTSTPFAPFPGFAPMPSYPEYSADFFDGEHFVMKGASPATREGAAAAEFSQLVPPPVPVRLRDVPLRKGRPMTPVRQRATRVPRADEAAAQFAADVRYYLMQDPRQLPSRYLYDSLGSALFEAICRLPWYRITRAEERLLANHGAEVLRDVAPLSTIVELGSRKRGEAEILVSEDGRRAHPLHVHLVDVSSSALEASARALESVADVHVTPHQASYEEGLREVRDRLDVEGRALVLLLGSNIGNFDPPGAEAFVHGVRSHLRAGDALLVGADLVKPERELHLAYDDPLGVTAAFNRNLLVRINRELGGNFDVGAFRHQAVWNEGESRVEMHLVSGSGQQIHVEAAQIAFRMEEGERIWTESSYKYHPDELVRLLEPAAFRLAKQWVDPDDRFALTLVEAV